MKHKHTIRKGDKVDYHSIIGGPVTLAGATVTEDPYQMASGHWVTFISGKSGCVSLDALTLAETTD